MASINKINGYSIEPALEIDFDSILATRQFNYYNSCDPYTTTETCWMRISMSNYATTNVFMDDNKFYANDGDGSQTSSQNSGTPLIWFIVPANHTFTFSYNGGDYSYVTFFKIKR